jgi:hypothetical protein
MHCQKVLGVFIHCAFEAWLQDLLKRKADENFWRSTDLHCTLALQPKPLHQSHCMHCFLELAYLLSSKPPKIFKLGSSWVIACKPCGHHIMQLVSAGGLDALLAREDVPVHDEVTAQQNMCVCGSGASSALAHGGP